MPEGFGLAAGRRDSARPGLGAEESACALDRAWLASDIGQIKMSRQETKDIAVLVMWCAVFTVTLPFLYKTLGGASPGFAFIVTLAPMGVMRYVHPVRRVGTPSFFHRLRDREYRPARARRIGLVAFAWFLRHSPLRLLNTSVYLRRWPGSPALVLTHVLEAEASHFWAFFAAMPYLAFALFHGWWAGFTVGWAVQICGNIYPYLHLRYTRSRLDAVIAHSVERSNRTHSPECKPGAGPANYGEGTG